MIPNRLMGKVFSVRLLIMRGTMPLGIFIGGVFSEAFGVRPLYLFIGLLISTVAFLGIILPYFKFIDDKLEPEEKSVS
jgi:F0F1-type ATP synthase assembly protein I